MTSSPGSKDKILQNGKICGICKNESALRRAWSFFSGKKRVIALLYWSVVTPALTMVWEVPETGILWKIYLTVGLLLSAIGLGHAGYKAITTNSIKSAGYQV